MTHSVEFSMSPADLTEVSKRLDGLADRIGTLMQAEAPNLEVVAAGRDEVSARVASTLNEVHGEFTKSADQGATEIHEIAATLRAHTDHVMALDQGFAG
jgi:hypothetical protein